MGEISSQISWQAPVSLFGSYFISAIALVSSSATLLGFFRAVN
jgi:hypothetical protein